MTSCVRWRACAACLLFVLIPVSEGLVINELRVPDMVEHDTNSTAILDCDYDITEKDVSFVMVKWYFNDDRRQVYQWGVGLRPADSGVLKGRTHLGHVASPDPFKMHRAISLTNPTAELTGKYICKVTTNNNVATASKKMVVYAPARVMNFTQEKPTTSSVNLTCIAEGVYPIPKLEIFTQQEGKSNSREPLSGVDSRVDHTEEGFFDVVAHRVVQDDELEGPTTFICVLTMVEVPYTLQKDIIYSSEPEISSKTVSSNAAVPTSVLDEKRLNGTDLASGSNIDTDGITLAASTSGVADRGQSASAGLLFSCILVALSCRR